MRCRQAHHHAHHHDQHHPHGQHSHHGDDPHPKSHPHHGSSAAIESAPPPLASTEKLIKLVEHWLRHNHDHARSFSDWAGRARALGHAEVAAIIEEVARESLRLNDQLEKCLDLLQSTPRTNA